MTNPELAVSGITKERLRTEFRFNESGRKNIRKSWEQGRCLCCDIAFDDDYVPEKARVVAELVKMCGECIERGHDRDDVLPKLLEALIDAG